ncbi:hypothetical protein [Lactiplantibacillus xiangfangensis]|uniref:hypothetical protein n=1 Tax=Lactiplantibacillus xiangfangensis TaxID=942150 RepID=UPI0038513ADE
MKKKNENSGAGAFLVALEMPIIWIVESVGLMLMWGWFIAPILNFTDIGLWQALGIVLLIGFMRPTSVNKISTDEAAAAGLTRITTSMVFILISWIVSLVV